MNKPNMRKQIDSMCKQCIYDGSKGGGTWRQQVTACTSPDCALFHLRPLAQGEKHTWQIELSKTYREDARSGKRKPLFSGELEDFSDEPKLPYSLTDKEA